MEDPMKVVFIGGGNMGEAMLSAAIDKKVISASTIIVCDISETRRRYLKQRYGVRVAGENLKPARESEIVVLAVKPQQISGVMSELSGRLTEAQLVISIAAGIALDTMSRALSHNRIVRAMPNTPAQVGAGITVWTATPGVSDEDMVRAGSIFESMGKQMYVSDERYLDMATAVSGSGPGYVFLFTEALAAAAIDLGLTPDMAEILVTETLLGSARYMQMSEKTPAELRQMVTSPGGTTAAALEHLERGSFTTLIRQAVRAAYDRAKDMGNR
jgi:pyrroline-5-carboxylate reductase